MRSTHTLPLVIGLLALPCAADTITRTDGKVIKDVTIVEETLADVLYKRGNNQQSVSSDEVLEVIFERKPRFVDEADQAVVDGDPIYARERFDLYVDGQINNPNERRKWAPAYAAWRSVEMSQLLDDLSGLVERADKLIANFPDSRYLPGAYLAKAGAQARLNKLSASRTTLQGLEQLVTSKSLSRRWALEAQLGLILTDTGMSGVAKREKLEEVIGDASGRFPTVANRAQVAVGETYLAEVLIAKEDKKLGLAREAETVFTEIVEDQKADKATLAGAFAGLGTAQFHIGAIEGDDAVSRSALMNLLRVIVLYEDHGQYVSQSMFYAMLIFKKIEDVDRYREMKWKLQQRYPQSSWASDAQNY